MSVAAEIAAAEAAAAAAAAATTAAAETAAATTAATTAAETAAAQQAAQAAAATTAAQAGAGAGSGIMSAAPTAAAVAGPESAMAAQAAQGGVGAAAGAPPAGLEQLTQGVSTSPIDNPVITTDGVPTPRISQMPFQNVEPPFQPDSAAAFQPAPTAPPNLATRGITAAPPPPPVAPPPPPPAGLEQFGPYPELTVSGPPPGGEAFTAKTPGGMYTLPGEGGAVPQSAFERGLDKAMTWAEKNPYKTAAIAYTGANALGLLNPNYSNFNSAPYTGPLSKYKLSENYKPGSANPAQFQYNPRYAEGGIMQMAQGGITGSGNLNLNIPLDLGGGQNGTQSTPDFAFGNGNSGANTGYFGGNSGLLQQLQQFKPDYQTDNFQSKSNPINVGGSAGSSDVQSSHDMQNFAAGGPTGNLSSTLEYYTKMMEGEKPKIPAQHPTDSGIYHDTDPDTRSLDPYSAARTRQAKLNKRAYVAAPKGPEPYAGGQLNLNPPGAKPDATQYQEAAKGGIMGVSNLGGYAAGGNPRLLKGPGDGMSDNIPATINGRQPARLADGEFVIPADVVSHLGNGSTEAGAKVLHRMMTKVRQERTGNPRQGKQINPNKYIPR